MNDLGILEKGPDGLFRLGPRLFILGKAAAGSSELIQTIHPYLESINNKFKLSTFLGILSNHDVVILDKADSAQKIKISSEIGMRISVLAGVAGKALLSQLPDADIDQILSQISPKQYTPRTIIDKGAYKKELWRVRETGLAYDREEYIEGLIAVGVPLQTNREDLQAAVWSVGLKQEFREETMTQIAGTLLTMVNEIHSRFSMSSLPSRQMNEMLN